MADELSELTDLGGGDPGLGQTSETQQIDQILCVAKIVLHPPVAPIIAEGMCQMDPAAELFQEVHRPVPPVTGFNDDLGVLAGGADRLGEGHHVVVRHLGGR